MANIIKRINFNPIGGATNAAGVSYDNTTSGLVAEDVQDAIDEVVVLIEEAQADADQAQLEVDNLEVVVSGVQANVAALDTRLDQAELDIDNLQAADVALDARLDTAEAEINTLQLDVVTAQTTADQAQIDATQALSDASDAQIAADAAQADIDAHIVDTSGAHAGSAISNTPSGNLAATNVQAALNELQTDVDTRATATALTDHVNDTAGAHAASAISNTPSGNLSSTDVQGALNELQGDINTNNTAISGLDTRIDAIEPYISTGDLSQSSFSITNNTSSAANVTGFVFTTRSFTALVSVTIIASSNLYQEVIINGINKGSSWSISYSGTGDESGVAFDITNAGQVQYTCLNYSGFVSGTVKFRAITTGV